MIPMALAKKILHEVDMAELERERQTAIRLGVTFDAYVASRMDALKGAPRAHVYLAQLRNARLERQRNILTTTIIPVDEPGTTDEEDRDDDTRAAIEGDRRHGLG